MSFLKAFYDFVDYLCPPENVKTTFIKETSLKYLVSNMRQETSQNRIQICQRFSFSKQLVS